MSEPAAFTSIQHITPNALFPHYKPTLFNLTIEIDLRKYNGFYPEKPKTFGQYIRKARLDKGLATKALAEMVGCTPEIILEWEKDRCVPGIKQLKKLNDVLEIPARFMRNAFARKFSLSKKEKDILFDMEKVRNTLVNCLDEAYEAGMTGRIEVFERFGFGSLLRMFRYSHFMTSREFARALNVDHSTVLDWEMGRNKPFGKMNRKIVLQINRLQVGYS